VPGPVPLPDSGGISTWIASVAAVAGAVLVKLLEFAWKRIAASQMGSSQMRQAEIAGSKDLRDEMFEQIEKLYDRVQRQDERISDLHNELMECQERHAQLSARYEFVIREVERQLPNFLLPPEPGAERK
jgi:septal ring factor EnvC (AmiA/AmiB activator)